MHPSSYRNMADLVARYLPEREALTVIDVGSYDVNGCYRPLFAHEGWRYIGADLEPGPNVDLVLSDPYRWDMPDAWVDLVVSGQAFEHIEYFWLTWHEMVRVLKPGGMIFLIAPSRGSVHRHPVDCWRFLPDGYQSLASYAGLELLEVRTDAECAESAAEDWGDTVGVFRKPLENQAASYLEQLSAQRVLSVAPSLGGAMPFPARLSDIDSWHRHIPFVFALIDMLRPRTLVELGTHKGDSYCAMCQAVQHFGLDTRCYAVDTWEGDPQAGLYGPEVLAELRAHHDPRYGRFSTLLQMTFDDAVSSFADGSIDLLHIDGLHTYDAVRHDFFTWLPKLSRRAVVLLHDTAEHASDFGVWKLWRELRERYEGFEFRFSHGLGVLLVGDERPEPLERFTRAVEQDFTPLEHYFYLAGNEIVLRKTQRTAVRLEELRDQLGYELDHARSVVAARDLQLGYAEKIVETRDAQLAERTQQLESVGAQLSHAMKVVAERDEQLRHRDAQLRRIERERDDNLSLAEQRASEIEQRQVELEQQAAQLKRMTTYLIEARQKLELVAGSRWWKLRRWLMRGLRRPDIELSADREEAGRPATNAPSGPQRVGIIVPVYRGLEETRACLESVLESRCRTAADILVINDASPEPELVAYLESLSDRVRLLHNERNLGFVATVNRGMAEFADRDVVLLNSDTLVANDWLDRLHACAYRSPDIGTVTPFSNNATICSYPQLGVANELPVGYTVGELDALFKRVNSGAAIPLPTAVGFCMYIRRDCLEQTGPFDEELFGRGYGEENEFCLRAEKYGWRHFLACDAFVYHAGGVSFAETQKTLQQRALAAISGLHPDYQARVQRFVEVDSPSAYRFGVDLSLAVKGRDHVVLMVNHGRGGGTERHLRELTAAVGERVAVLTLRPFGGENQAVALTLPALGENNRAVFDPETGYPILVRLLKALGVGRVHFHHTIGVHPRFWRIPEELEIPYDFTVHDYYLACPQVTMTTVEGIYCGEPVDEGCARCLQQRPAPGGASIGQWRDANARILYGAERVFVPSRDAERRIQRYFQGVNTVFVPHESGGLSVGSPFCRRLAPDQALRVVVIGALSEFKGANLLEACALDARKRRLPIEFHLIGFAYRPLSVWPVSNLRSHGRYEEEDLPRLIAEVGPHLAWFPGSCPETYSYTLSACLASGLPVVAHRVGSFAERLTGRGGSWLLEIGLSPQGFNDFFTALRGNFSDGRLPEVDGSQLEPATFSYTRDYCKGFAESAPGEFNWEALYGDYYRGLLSHARILPEYGNSLGARVFRALRLLKRNGRLAGLSTRVPLGWRIRIKNWLLQTAR